MKRSSQSLSELASHVNQVSLIFLVDGVFAITMTLLVAVVFWKNRRRRRLQVKHAK